MARGENGTPDKPGGGDGTPVRALDVRSLRELVAKSARVAAPIEVDRPYAEALRNSVDWLWQTDPDFNLTYVSRPLDDRSDERLPGESWLGRSLLSLAEAEAEEATPSPLLVALRERRAFRDCTVEWTSEDQQRVRRAYRVTLCRVPENAELKASQQFVDRYRTAAASPDTDPATLTQEAWAAFARTLLVRNEFLFVE